MSKSQQSKVLTATPNFGLWILISITLMFWLPHEDGFNISKFALLIFLGFYSFLGFSVLARHFISKDFLILAACGFFVTTLVLSTLNSQNIYKSVFGGVGRYTGLIAYLAGVFILLYFAFHNKPNLDLGKQMILTVAGLGVAQTAYGWIQYLDLDPISWNTPYGSMIGTVGNANFAGFFVGMGSVALVWSYLLSSRNSLKLLFVIVVLFIEQTLLLATNVRQGTLVSVFGFIFVLLWLTRRRLQLFISACSAFFVLLVLIVLGILQKGPLDFLYKSSISIRGDYWRAAKRMFLDYPFQGIGLGNFGDFFAFYRDQLQVQRSGIGTLADSAHNLFLDLAVAGGIFLPVAFLSVIASIAYSLISSWSNKSELEKGVLLALISLYTTYFAQALISVENISSLSWGFALLGVIYSLTRSNKKSRREVPLPSILFSLISLSLTVLIIKPMWISNTLVKESQSINLSGNAQTDRVKRLKLLTEATSENPRDAFYYQSAARILLNARQIEGEKFALKALELNPRDLRSAIYLWGFYIQIDDRENAERFKKVLVKLDPLAEPLLSQEG